MNHGQTDKYREGKPICLCGKVGNYSNDWDSYYCSESNVWLEDGCGKDCKYFHCVERPATAQCHI